MSNSTKKTEKAKTTSVTEPVAAVTEQKTKTDNVDIKIETPDKSDVKKETVAEKPKKETVVEKPKKEIAAEKPKKEIVAEKAKKETVAEKAKKETMTEMKVEKTKKETAGKAKKDAAKSAKKATTKKASKKETEMSIYVQYADMEIDSNKIVEQVKEAWVSEGHRVSSIKSLDLYIKPEESATYFVINNKEAGKIEL